MQSTDFGPIVSPLMLATRERRGYAPGGAVGPGGGAAAPAASGGWGSDVSNFISGLPTWTSLIPGVGALQDVNNLASSGISGNPNVAHDVTGIAAAFPSPASLPLGVLSSLLPGGMLDNWLGLGNFSSTTPAQSFGFGQTPDWSLPSFNIPGTGFWGGFQDFAGNVGDALGSAASWVGNGIGDAFSSLGDFFGGLGADIFGGGGPGGAGGAHGGHVRGALSHFAGGGQAMDDDASEITPQQENDAFAAMGARMAGTSPSGRFQREFSRAYTHSPDAGWRQTDNPYGALSHMMRSDPYGAPP